MLKDKYNPLIDILFEVRSYVDLPNTNVTWSRFKDVDEALEYLDFCIESLRQENESALDDLMLLFAPTGSLQEISISSGWGNKFLEISSRFDATLTLPRSGDKLKESQMIECPWCEAKVELGIKQCPECENEIIDFDTRQDEIVESPSVGGLLLLYVATCVISIFLIMYNYLIIVRYGFSVYNWTSYSAFIAIYNFMHLFILIVTILLIFKKRKFVPKLIVGFEGLNLVSLAISYFLANDLPQKALIMGATIKVVWLCLWICYFLFSKRVKQTFIH